MNLQTYLNQSNKRKSHFADEIGVAPSTVTRWIKGERFPSPRQMRQISEATGGEVTANDFYSMEPAA